MGPVSNLSIIVIPQWVRVTIILILSLLSLLYLTFAVIGIVDDTRPGWIEAGTYLLGTLIPLILVGLILSFSQSGVEALAERTSAFLSSGIPSLTRLFYEPQGEFRRARDLDIRKMPAPNRPRVFIQSNRAHSIANYRVELEAAKIGLVDDVVGDLVCAFRLEINAVKANINVLFPVDGAQAEAVVKDFAACFPHTVEGAKFEGYHFSSTPIKRKVDGKDYHGMVCSKRLEDDFLTNPISRLAFGQDLIIMLRALIVEAPDHFVQEPSEAPPVPAS